MRGPDNDNVTRQRVMLLLSLNPIRYVFLFIPGYDNAFSALSMVTPNVQNKPSAFNRSFQPV